MLVAMLYGLKHLARLQTLVDGGVCGTRYLEFSVLLVHVSWTAGAKLAVGKQPHGQAKKKKNQRCQETTAGDRQQLMLPGICDMALSNQAE